MQRFAFFSILSIILISTTACTHAQTGGMGPMAADKAMSRQRWIDSVYNRLNEDERIGQLFMVAAYSGGDNYNQPAIEKLISNHSIGGLIFMQGTPEKQAAQTNRYQAMAQVPLLLAMDAEWGLGMRLTGVQNFPRQMMLGASRDERLVHDMGAAIAAQCNRMGVHIDFAPDVDVNNNPGNPVINTRSFGEYKKWVAQLGIAYMKGLQDNGVMACAKHFPGHGDVSVDSHLDLPVINKSRAQLDTLELYPFRELVKAGVQSVMIAHLSVPSLETAAHVPTTLSYNTVTNVLKHDLRFNGLIFTDALNMQGVTKYFPAGDADARAFEAGCDVLLFSQDVPAAIGKIKALVKSGKVSQQDLAGRVKKILAAKWDAGLHSVKPIKVEGATDDLNAQIAAINSKAAECALTIVRSEKNLITLTKNSKVLYVAVNGNLDTKAEQLLRNAVGSLSVMKYNGGGAVPAALRDQKQYDAVIIGVHGLSWTPGKNYGLESTEISFLNATGSYPKAIVAVMGNAYAIKYACNAKTILCGYEDNEWTNMALVKALTGELKPRGVLPVTPPCLK